MENNLSELIEHITYFYQHIPSAYDSDIQYEVYLKDGKWTIKNLVTESTIILSDDIEALEYMIEANLDLSILHSYVLSDVCTEGVLRRNQLLKVEDLVGVEAINEVEKAWEKFADTIKEIVCDYDEEKVEKTSALKLVVE